MMNLIKKLVLPILGMIFLFSACSETNTNLSVVKNTDSVNQVILESTENEELEITEEVGVGSLSESVSEEEQVGISLSNQPGMTNSILTDDEIESLQFMREEEKLAGDVYNFLYDLWGSQIFANIASSENTHTEAVLTLISQYGLEDPAQNNAMGQFTNPELQQLYNELTTLGSQSLAEALKVGAVIEEIDVIDLEDRMAQTENPDIIRVYTNLLKGSQNHLRAFVRNLGTKASETYLPQFLSPESYNSIIQND
jgi:hypothetical protein